LSTALLLTGTAMLAIAGPAFAHAELNSSDPAKDASLSAAPQQIKLTFSEAVDVPAGAITVAGADGSQWTVGQAVRTDAVITVPVTPAGPAGQYTISYKVISDDGDAVTGKIPFTLTAAVPTSTQPATTTAQQATPTAQETQSTGGVPVWIWIVGAVILVAVGVVVAMRTRRT
jgi:methionine-rich copper-binding protein CopC